MKDQLVSAEWLSNHLKDENLVVADCRFALNDAEAGHKQYEQGHIPGAVYFDLEKDLSGPKGEHGGRHPLPDLEEFTEKLGKAGIDETKEVVVYDDQNGSFAARLWWMLRYLGHDKVAVLNVSFSKWADEGYPISTEKPNPAERTFTPHLRPEMAVDIEKVKTDKGREDVVLIDSRAPERYRGDKEPMDSKAGHIPGAENYFWKGNVADGGKWKSADELKKRFQSIKGREPIVYCGSGVTANANVLALKSIGKEAKLYIGSWSDWSSYEDNPVETGDRKN
ncbi:MAG TPA: sulfurtransferase [Bacillales bacterium]|nr:sulfurtransferase [Bacillales bacterium]